MKVKYTDRKAAPMKWHHFLTGIGLPVCILSILFVMYQFITEMFFPDAFAHGEMLNTIIKAYDSSLSVFSPGILIWPLIVSFLVLTADLILHIGTWIGLLRYKPYGKNLWLFLIGFVTCILSAVSVLWITESREVLARLGILVLSGDLKRLFSILLAVMILITIALWIFFILNIIYYHKRRFLFTDYYIQPVNESAVMVQTKEVSGEPVTEKEQPDSVKDDVVSMNPETSQEEQTELEEPVSETNDPETADHSVETEETQNEQDTNDTHSESENNTSMEDTTTEETDKPAEQSKTLRFCPYCGHTLDEADVHFCSHCGHKLD